VAVAEELAKEPCGTLKIFVALSFNVILEESFLYLAQIFLNCKKIPYGHSLRNDRVRRAFIKPRP
jgi:hypothetical protein